MMDGISMARVQKMCSKGCTKFIVEKRWEY